MNIKAAILLLAVTLASCQGTENFRLQQRNLGLLSMDFSKTVDNIQDGIKDTVNTVKNVVSLTGAKLTEMTTKLTTQFKDKLKDFSATKYEKAIKTLAQFDDDAIAGSFAKLKSFGTEAAAGMKTLFSKVSDDVMKIGGKAMTLHSEISEKVKKSCGDKFKEAQESMVSGLEDMYKLVSPNALKDKGDLVRTLPITSVSDYAASIQKSVTDMSKWTKEGFMAKFKIPKVSDITNVACEGTCKAECEAVKKSSEETLKEMFAAIDTGKNTLQNVFSDDKNLGESILGKMKETTTNADAQVQLMCSTTEALGDQIKGLKSKAEKILKNYQSKFCTSKTNEFAKKSGELLKCLFKSGKGVAIVASPIRKNTKEILKAVESVACTQKSGRMVDFKPKRVFKNVKFNLDAQDLTDLKNNAQAVKDRVAKTLKDSSKGKAASVIITKLEAASRRRLQSGNANGEFTMDMNDDDGFTFDPVSSTVVISGEEGDPSFAGSEMSVSSTSTDTLSEGSAKGISALVSAFIVAQVAFFNF